MPRVRRHVTCTDETHSQAGRRPCEFGENPSLPYTRSSTSLVSHRFIPAELRGGSSTGDNTSLGPSATLHSAYKA